MNIKQFDKTDFDEVSSWYHKRNQTPVPLEHLPQFGYIIPGIACGFLVQTDSTSAFLEGFATNPEAQSYHKIDALDAIAKKLIEVAKELGYSHVFAMTTHPTIVAACRDNEFVSLGKYTMFFREVK